MPAEFTTDQAFMLGILLIWHPFPSTPAPPRAPIFILLFKKCCIKLFYVLNTDFFAPSEIPHPERARYPPAGTHSSLPPASEALDSQELPPLGLLTPLNISEGEKPKLKVTCPRISGELVRHQP